MRKSVWMMLLVITALLLNACKLGYTLDDDEDGSGSNSNVFAGPSDGASWRLSMSKTAESFTLTKRPTPTSNIEYSVNGTFERLDSGFVEYTITTTPLPSAISSATFVGVEVAESGVVLFPVETNDYEFMPLVPYDDCPESDLRINWLAFDSQSDATNVDHYYAGEFRYLLSSEAIRLTDGVALQDFNVNADFESIDSATCSSGIAQTDDGDQYLSSTSAVIEFDEDSYARVLALPRTSVGEVADLDGEYVGFARKYSNIESIDYASASCSAGLCDVYYQTDVDNITQANRQYRLEMVADQLDYPANGMLQGTLTRMDEFRQTGHTLCIANTDLLPDDSDAPRMLSCVAQSPQNPQFLVTLLLVSQDH